MNFRIFLLCLLIPASIFATFPEKETDSDTLTFWQKSPSPLKSRIRPLNYSIGGMYGLSMTWLYSQWYADYPKSPFHFFNDNSEWLQMDKFAHCWTAYNVSKPVMRCYNWAGYDEKKSTIIGSGVALLFQTTVEVFDGFSEEWGFSWGDMLSNVAGVTIFAGQQLTWHEQRIVLKFSFHQTEYAKYRTDLLGSEFHESILKDYNGQTLWTTINPRSFFKSSSFPRWISIAFGYGAEGMTGGDENPATVDGVPIPQFERYRQYYLSIDFDLARIKTKNQFLNSVFKMINIIHLPAPAIEWSSGHKPKYWGMYF